MCVYIALKCRFLASRHIAELLRIRWNIEKMTTRISRYAISVGWPYYEVDYNIAFKQGEETDDQEWESEGKELF